ncbi:MAG: T9SS type A sorting domain-containing protein [Bacteroidota bacterium]
MNSTLIWLKTLMLTVVVSTQINAQNCDNLGLVSSGFLLGEFDCEVLIISSDGIDIFQPSQLTEALTPGSLIQFSYTVLDSTDCSDKIPLIDITCLTPFIETVEETCGFAIESTTITDSNDTEVFELEVYNETDFGPYRPATVRWYEYETGTFIGDTPIVRYQPSENSPTVINVCADITTDSLANGTNCSTTICYTIIPESVTAFPEICQALLAYQPADQLADNGTINFYNVSFGNYTQAIWDFGDGQQDTTTALSLTHTYARPGLYEVCLTIDNEDSSCVSKFCLPVFTVGGDEICNFNDCVLPGDTNKDGLVNIFDVLNLGIGFNTSGNVRPNAVIDLILQAAFDWEMEEALDLNYKHLDCDGNGLIDELDYLAIDQNYQPIDTKETVSNNSDLPTVKLEFSSDTLFLNPNNNQSRISAQLSIGSAVQPVNNFYGLALSYNYQNPLVSGVEVAYNENSFLGTPSNVLVKNKQLSSANQIGIAITKNNQAGNSGSGNIVTVSFILEHDIIDGRSEVVELDLDGLTVVDPNGDEIPVSVPEDAPAVVLIFQDSLSVSVEESLTEDDFSVFPNPATDNLVIELVANLEDSNNQVVIYNALGQIVQEQTLAGQQTILDISDLKAGMYWVKVATEKGIGVREIVIE